MTLMTFTILAICGNSTFKHYCREAESERAPVGSSEDDDEDGGDFPCRIAALLVSSLAVTFRVVF